MKDINEVVRIKTKTFLPKNPNGENRSVLPDTASSGIGDKHKSTGTGLISKADLEARLEELYIAEVKRLVKFLPASLSEMEKTHPEIKQKIKTVEDELNRIWFACLDDKATESQFKRILDEYGRVIMECIELHNHSRKPL